MKKHLVVILIVGVLIKVSLFLFSVIDVPQSKFLTDSGTYLETGERLISKGVFTIKDAHGGLQAEINRTPGYPLFLGIVHHFLKLPLSGVIFIQVLLTILVVPLTYRIGLEIDPKLAFLSASIVLYSPIITIYSLFILTESLFLFLMTLFMFYFIKYLKNGGIKLILASAFLLVMAVYVRPGAYYLGIGIAGFILYANVTKNIKNTISDAIIFLVVVYILLGVWQIRNYAFSGNPVFSIILLDEPVHNGLFSQYSTSQGYIVQGMHSLNVAWKCLLSIMTRPGTLKYFHSPALTILGKIIAYPWTVFWMTGFLFGVTRIKNNIYFQFLLFVVICFVGGSIIGESWYVGERFRVPIMPFIAIISSYGWLQLITLVKGSKEFSPMMGKGVIK